MVTRFIDIKIRSKSAERNVDNLDRKMKGLGRTVDGTTKQIGQLSKIAIGVFSAIALNNITKYADAFTSLQNQIRQTTNSTEELAQRTNDLLAISNRSRAGISATAELFTQLTLSTENLNLTTEEQLRLTETISKSFAVSGKSAAEAAGAIRQLGQAFAAGALRGDEFNSIAEGAPEIMRALQRSLKLTQGELRAFAATGGITAEILVKALGEAAEVIDEKMSKAVATFAQNMEIANNNMTIFIGSSSEVQNVIGGAGNSLVVASENIETIAKFATLAAAVFAARLAPALTESSVKALDLAKSSTVAATANAKLAAESKKLATSEFSATKITVTKARQDLVAARATSQKAKETVIAARAAKASAVADVESAKSSILSAKATEEKIISNNIYVTSLGRTVPAQKATVIWTDRLTIAKKSAAIASKDLAAAEVAVSLAATNVTAANAAASPVIATSTLLKNASAKASVNLASANAAMSLSARAAASSIGFLKASLALIGGPLGAAFIAATAIFLFVDAAESAEEKASRLSTEVDVLTSSFSKLTAAQRVTETSRINNEFKTLSAELVIANDRLVKVREGVFFRGKTSIIAGLEDEVNSLNDQLDILSVKRQAIFAGGLPQITGAAEAPADKKESKFIIRLKLETEALERELRARQLVSEGILSEEESRLALRFDNKATQDQVRVEAELIKLGEDEDAKAAVRAAFDAQQLANAELFEQGLTEITVSESEKRIAQARTEEAARAAASNKLIGIGVNLGTALLKNQISSNAKSEKEKKRARRNGVIIDTAAGISLAFATNPFPVAVPIAATIAATGIANIATINSASGISSPPSSGAGGGGLEPVARPTPAAQDIPQQTKVIELRTDGTAFGLAVAEATKDTLESFDEGISVSIATGIEEAKRIGAI